MTNTPMPFEEWKKERDAKQAQQLAVIEELKAQVQMYQELIGKGQPAKYRQTIAELVEALEVSKEILDSEGVYTRNVAKIEALIAKVKGK